MRRLVWGSVSWALLLSAVGVGSAQDQVRYIDRAARKEAVASGSIQEESAKGITVRLIKPAESKLIPATDVREVEYQVPTALRIEFRSPFAKEERAIQEPKEDARKKLQGEALAEYRALLPRLAESKHAQRYVQFRTARLLAAQADEGTEPADPAIKALVQFKAEHPNSWEIVPCTRLLGRLQAGKGDLAAAQKTYEAAANRTDVPPEFRQECQLRVVEALLAARQHAEAEKRLQGLAGGLAKDDPQAARVQVYLAKCQIVAGKGAEAEAQLRAILGGAADGLTKGPACNTLAEYYRQGNRPEDAFWLYLWVDVLYNQDREAHAEALYHLSKLFQQVKNDAARAQECQERLAQGKEFVGSKYQQMALLGK
jgi:hypothetical protein